MSRAIQYGGPRAAVVPEHFYLLLQTPALSSCPVLLALSRAESDGQISAYVGRLNRLLSSRLMGGIRHQNAPGL